MKVVPLLHTYILSLYRLTFMQANLNIAYIEATLQADTRDRPVSMLDYWGGWPALQALASSAELFAAAAAPASAEPPDQAAPHNSSKHLSISTYVVDWSYSQNHDSYSTRWFLLPACNAPSNCTSTHLKGHEPEQRHAVL